VTEHVIKDKSGRVVERHPYEAAMLRAFWILTAHELKNGREAQYTMHPAPVTTAPELLPLQSWVVYVLKEEGLYGGKTE
jgi:hypothetical protein